MLPFLPRMDILLVIPCYRETLRLPAFLGRLVDELAGAPFSTSILVVDDGSPATDQEALSQLIHPETRGNCTLLPPLLLARNTRKGGAILAGWRSMNAGAYAFVDADGAIPAEEVRRGLEYSRNSEKPPAVMLAVRRHDMNTPVTRSPLRKLCGRAFAKVAGLLLGFGIEDTQCGFKLVTGEAFHAVAEELRGCGFCFDLELLLRIRTRVPAARVVPFPVRWTAQPGGSFNIFRHAPRMLLGVVSLSLGRMRWPFHGQACEATGSAQKTRRK